MVRYLAIASDLKANFLRNNFPDGHPLPPEHELCGTYATSRTTIRAALDWLERQGLILRRQGSGTFYRSPVITRSLGSMTDFHTEAILAGRQPHTKVIGLTVRPPTLSELVCFGRENAGKGIAELRRVRYVDSTPGVLQISYLAASVLGRVRKEQFCDDSLYKFLERRRGITIDSIEETLEPANIGSAEAELLEIEAGTAVFRSHRIARDAVGTVIELGDILIRGDVCRFSVNRRASEAHA